MLWCYKPELNAVLTPASSAALHDHLSCYSSHSILKIVRTRGKMHTTEVIQLTICKRKLIFFFSSNTWGCFWKLVKGWLHSSEWLTLWVQPFTFTCSHVPLCLRVLQLSKEAAALPQKGNSDHCTTSYQPLLFVSCPEDLKIRKQVL